MKMPHEIIVDEKIKLIKIEKDFNQEELIENLEDINDKSIQDFLGMDKNINKEIEETSFRRNRLWEDVKDAERKMEEDSGRYPGGGAGEHADRAGTL